MTAAVLEPSKAKGPGSDGHLRQLTPLLVWAVVFCDIGTSVYYVPGILYERVGDAAPLFVLLGLVGFVLLAQKYVEICWRKPDGGGVVTIASEAFTPLVGCFGGMMISVGYFVTSSISSVSGIHYLASLFPWFEGRILSMSVATLVLLAIVNTVGIRESAWLSLVMAIASFVSNLAVIGFVVAERGWSVFEAFGPSWRIATSFDLELHTVLIGTSTAWLAFSGLESISQLSPAMKEPLKETARKGMRLVVITMLISAPILTTLAIGILPAAVKAANSEHFISELGGTFGGLPLKLAVVIAGSSLLLLAANTAIIGSYHVFLALTANGFMPSTVARRNRTFETPQIAIVIATFVPILVILVSGGSLQVLAGLYAFGLLGAFLLSSLGIDVLRWRDRDRGLRFWAGVFTTVLVLVAFGVTLGVEKQATAWGSALVICGMLLAVGTRRKWFADLFYRMPLVAKIVPARIEETEQRFESQELEIFSLAQAEEVRPLYPSRTMIAIRGPNPGLVSEAIRREKGLGGSTLYALYVEERTGLFVGSPQWKPKEEGVLALKNAVQAAEAQGMMLVPVWTVSYNAVEGIARAAESLGVDAIFMGVSQRNAIWHLVRGHVLSGLAKRLPQGIRLLIYS